jgi:hypothetical protein
LFCQAACVSTLCAAPSGERRPKHQPAIAVDEARNRVYVAWTIFSKDTADLDCLAIYLDPAGLFAMLTGASGGWHAEMIVSLGVDSNVAEICDRAEIDKIQSQDFIDPVSARQVEP